MLGWVLNLDGAGSPVPSGVPIAHVRFRGQTRGTVAHGVTRGVTGASRPRIQQAAQAGRRLRMTSQRRGG